MQTSVRSIWSRVFHSLLLALLPLTAQLGACAEPGL